jgi:tetratricopeptide (TPR) repeat protein
VAAAQPADPMARDRDRCISPANAVSTDEAIVACTALIESAARGGITPQDAASAHIARGNLYAVQGAVDRAIADYDHAIALDPTRAVAFFNRAGAVAASGDIDRALTDYNRAIELDPKDADPYVGRGRLAFAR